MALSSMTGFARTQGEHAAMRWHWEIKSVNGRGLDLRLRLPAGFDGLEARLREILTAQVKRGNCQANLQLDRSGREPVVTVNQSALQVVLAAIGALQNHAQLGPASPDGILALKGVLDTAEPEQSDEERAALEDEIAASFADAVAALKISRDQEGARIAAVVENQIDEIARLTQAASDCAAARLPAIRDRIQSKLDELLAGNNPVGDDRLAQEVALLATKQDVREEIDRLRAHVQHARELLGKGESNGRRLDFLTQEFNREANTLCSKAADIDLTRIGLELKAVIDQLREQVQNIE